MHHMGIVVEHIMQDDPRTAEARRRARQRHSASVRVRVLARMRRLLPGGASQPTDVAGVAAPAARPALPLAWGRTAASN